MPARGDPASSNVTKKSCLRLGQLGHWARDCSLQVDYDALKSRCADEDERHFLVTTLKPGAQQRRKSRYKGSIYAEGSEFDHSNVLFEQEFETISDVFMS